VTGRPLTGIYRLNICQSDLIICCYCPSFYLNRFGFGL